MRDTLHYISASQQSAASLNSRRSVLAPTTDDENTSELDLSGGGDLVIDLDRKDHDQEGKASQTPQETEESCELMKMNNSVEHQAIVEKGLKMKIKRKGLSSGTRGSGSAEAAAQKSDQKSSPVGGRPESVNIKQNGTEKSKTPVNVRNNTKRGKDKTIKSGQESALMTPLVGAVASSAVGSTASTGSPTTTNAMLTQANLAAGITGTVSVELNRLPSTQFPVIKKESTSPDVVQQDGPGMDPYDFNSKSDDMKPATFKKCKIEKVRILLTYSFLQCAQYTWLYIHITIALKTCLQCYLS